MWWVSRINSLNSREDPERKPARLTMSGVDVHQEEEASFSSLESEGGRIQEFVEDVDDGQRSCDSEEIRLVDAEIETKVWIR